MSRLFPILAFRDKAAMDDCVKAFVWINMALVNSFLQFDAEYGCNVVSDDNCEACTNRRQLREFVECRLLFLKKKF